jgi:hypothetical protein
MAPIVLGSVVIPLTEAIAVLIGVAGLAYRIHSILNNQTKRSELAQDFDRVGNYLDNASSQVPNASPEEVIKAHIRLGQLTRYLTTWQEGLERNSSDIAKEFLGKVNSLLDKTNRLSSDLSAQSSSNPISASLPLSTYNPPSPTVLPGRSTTPNDAVRDRANSALNRGKTPRNSKTPGISRGIIDGKTPDVPAWKPPPVVAPRPDDWDKLPDGNLPDSRPGNLYPIRVGNNSPMSQRKPRVVPARTAGSQSQQATNTSQPFCNENPWTKILRDLLQQLGEGIGQEELEDIINKGGKAFEEAFKAREEAIRKDPNFDRGMPDLKKTLQGVVGKGQEDLKKTLEGQKLLKNLERYYYWSKDPGFTYDILKRRPIPGGRQDPLYQC